MKRAELSFVEPFVRRVQKIVALALGTFLVTSCSGPSSCSVNYIQGLIAIQTAQMTGGAA